MSVRPDFVVYSSGNEPRLVVEVKGKQDVSEDWASRFRGNLVRHGFLPRAPFFMLVLPDQLFLWRNRPEVPDAPPDLRIRTVDVLRPFFDSLGTERMDEPSLELSVQAWMNVLTSPGLETADIERSHSWILETGLLDAVRGGRVEIPSAA